MNQPYDLWCMLGQRPPHPLVNRMTHVCKNITLPQTPFDKKEKQEDVVISSQASFVARWPDTVMSLHKQGFLPRYI